ncbi:phosphotransferase family protein [Streptomyces sp. NPDC002308]
MPHDPLDQRVSPTGEPSRNGRAASAGDPVAAALSAVGPLEADVLARENLTGGTYNTVTGITLADGRRWVVKTPPAHPSGLSYERDLLVNEVAFYRSAADPRVPQVVRAELDPAAPGGPHLIMTTLPGQPWTTVADALTADERLRLRTELGGLVAGLHAVTGTDGFGYPAAPLGPPAATWREAFTAMTDAVLADADTFRAWLPVPAVRIREALAGAAYVLDDVTRPALVHFDLWDGNLLVDGGPGDRRLGGVVDGERMFWGDPVADFVSLALPGNLADDAAFLAGYAAGGGDAEFTPSVRVRLALYGAYLYLIMLVEAAPRGYGPEQRGWLRAEIGPRLVAALAEVVEAAGGA